MNPEELYEEFEMSHFQCLPLRNEELIEYSDKTGFLMASPEKALCDKFVFTRNLNIASPRVLRELLFDDLRLDEESITRFDPKVIEACIMPGMKEKMLRALLELVNSMKGDLKKNGRR
jgi:hypothetical protein